MYYYAALCAIVKDEDAFLAGWITYHCSIGFEHAFIYDNGSAHPVKEVLAPFVDAGLVTVIDFPYTQSQQLSAYFHCLSTYKHQCRWMAFIDADEYLVPKKHDDIKDFLDDYRNYGGVAVNWRVFGSNGHLRSPSQDVPLAYPNYVYDDTHIKSIVDPQRTLKPLSPHHFTFTEGAHCVNEAGIPLQGPFSYIAAESIQINHYYYKSQEDFTRKVLKGRATQSHNKHNRNMNMFYEQARLNGYPDTAITALMPVYTLFSQKTPAVMARIRHTDALTPLNDYVEAISKAIATNDVATAWRNYCVASRYHNDLQMFLMGVHLLLLRDKPQEAHDMLVRRLLEAGSDFSLQARLYTALSKVHAHIGHELSAQSMLAYAKAMKNGV